MRIQSLLFFLLMFGAKADAQMSPAAEKPPANNKSKAGLYFKIISASEGSFGYDIYKDGRTLIHQPTIPGMPGNNGFKDVATAARVANLVIQKLEAGQMPPTLTIEDLQKVKAIN